MTVFAWQSVQNGTLIVLAYLNLEPPWDKVVVISVNYIIYYLLLRLLSLALSCPLDALKQSTCLATEHNMMLASSAESLLFIAFFSPSSYFPWVQVI